MAEFRISLSFTNNLLQTFLIDIFDKALALNEITLKKVKQKKEDEFHEIYELVNICAKHKTYIYMVVENSGKLFISC